MGDAGRAIQGWRKLGEEIQGYRLVGYDAAFATLTLRDNLGKEYKLVLPEGRVLSNRLSDEEFERLRAQLESPNSEAAIPLTRETARQFWVRMIETITPPVFSPDIYIDTQGTTLSEKDKKEFLWWQEFKSTEGSFVVAYRVDGMTDLMEGPRNPFKLPDHMTRSLLPQDWQELGLLSAVAKVQAEAMRRHRPEKTNKTPEPTPPSVMPRASERVPK